MTYTTNSYKDEEATYKKRKEKKGKHCNYNTLFRYITKILHFYFLRKE